MYCILLALTPKEIKERFAPILKLADVLKSRASKVQISKSGQLHQEPLITVSIEGYYIHINRIFGRNFNSASLILTDQLSD